jgi:hypothetical protein
MSIRFPRTIWSVFILLLALPQLAAAQYWVVRDSVTNQIVYPNGTVSVIDDISYPTVAQRVYNITNVSGVPLSIGPCSVTSVDQSFLIGAWTSGTLLPGLTTSIAIQHVAKTVGTQTATVQCQSAVGLISFQVQGRVLAPNPYIVIETSKGKNVANNSTFNFGSTLTGTPLDQSFVITNMGNQTLMVSLALSGSAYSVSTAPLSSITKGGTTTFSLRLLSATAGTFTGQLRISNNDPNNNPFTVNLTGTVSPPATPQIKITDSGNGGAVVAKSSTINLGNVQPNSPITRTFSIANTGTATLSISNNTSILSGTGFTLASSSGNSVVPGGNTLFTIRFSAGSAGTYTGTVSIASNDPDDNPFTFFLQAIVVPPTPVVTLTASDPAAAENPLDNGQITLTRTGSTASPLSVNVSISGTATNGTDYNFINTTQTFAAGQSTLNIPVVPIDDTVVEDVETATFTLVAGTGYTVGNPSSGTVSISNNDFTPCVPSATLLCFQSGRFQATLTATANGTNYAGQAVSLSDTSGGFWLFSPDNIEVGVKILDGSSVNGKFWIYHGAATDVAYSLTVTDRANPSRAKTFSKPAGSFCGGADTGSFSKALAQPETASLELDGGEEKTTYVKALACVADSTTACLLNNRFKVRVKLGTAYQQVIPFTSQTGFFWFFSPDNLEILVKVLDGTSLNGRYWVYFGALTDQAYTVEVTDTATGAVKSYPSPGAYCGTGDTSAF